MTYSFNHNYDAYIDGEFVPSSLGYYTTTNPATGDTLCEIARCGVGEIEIAYQAANRAFPAWSQTSVEERSRILQKIADVIDQNLEMLSFIDTMEMGRRLYETQYDHMIASGQYRYFASIIHAFGGESRSIDNGLFFTRKEPLGVIGQIVPWNVPAIMLAMKLAPALATGNTVVLKPDENASLSTLVLCDLIGDLLPPGVLNVVPGLGTESGQAILSHPGMAKLAFTGSEEVGRMVATAGAKHLIPVTLELGGKSPNIIFPDVTDLDAIVDNAAFAAMYCNGQSCVAGTRLFVHSKIYDDFMDRLTTHLSHARVGAPTMEGVNLSCLVSEKQGKRVLKYIDIAQKEGAILAFGGERVAVPGCEAGYFIQPTVFEAKNSMRIAQEEIFGPVLSVIKWDDYDTMIAEANGTCYGLAAGIYTSDISSAMTTANQLQAGSIWINQYFNLQNGHPFGGYKASGIGREFCMETLENYTQTKTITLVNKVPNMGYITAP